MPFRDHKGFIFSETVASAVLPGQVVRIVGTTAGLVIPATNSTVEPFGAVEASAIVGEKVTIYGDANIVKVKAAASLGVGADCAPGGGTVGMLPVVASGMYRTGVSLDAAAAGDSFSLFVSVRRALA